MAVQRTNYGVATPELEPITVGFGLQGLRDPASGRVFSPSSNGGLVEYNPQTQDFDLQVFGDDLPDTPEWQPYKQSLMGFNSDPGNLAIANHSTDSYTDKYGPMAMSLAVPAAGLWQSAAAAAGSGAGFMDTLAQVPGAIGDKFTSLADQFTGALGGTGGVDPTMVADAGGAVTDAGAGFTVPEPAWEATVDPGMVRGITGTPYLPSVPEPAWESTVDPSLAREKMLGPLPPTSPSAPPQAPGGQSSTLGDLTKAAVLTGAASALAPDVPQGDDPADVLRQQEADRQARIAGGTDRVNQTFGQYGDDYYNSMFKAGKDYYGPQLGEQYSEALRRLPMNFASTKNSAFAREAGNLERDRMRRETDVNQMIQGRVNERRGEVERHRADLIGQLNAGSDADTVATQATERAKSLTAPPEFSPLGDMFSKYTGMAANQAIVDAQPQPFVRGLTFGPRKGSVTNVG